MVYKKIKNLTGIVDKNVDQEIKVNLNIWLTYSSIGEDNGTGTVACTNTYNHNPVA